MPETGNDFCFVYCFPIVVIVTISRYQNITARGYRYYCYRYRNWYPYRTRPCRSDVPSSRAPPLPDQHINKRPRAGATHEQRRCQDSPPLVDPLFKREIRHSNPIYTLLKRYADRAAVSGAPPLRRNSAPLRRVRRRCLRPPRLIELGLSGAPLLDPALPHACVKTARARGRVWKLVCGRVG
jgi:hypothetical protein